ncbi:hypothetical protein IMX07_00840 [bacterium]|nr:hypothetical protein [bacterium]
MSGQAKVNSERLDAGYRRLLLELIDDAAEQVGGMEHELLDCGLGSLASQAIELRDRIRAFRATAARRLRVGMTTRCSYEGAR